VNVITKVFVALHVVLSLVLVSGLVVYVNRTDEFAKQAQVAETNLKRERELRVLADQQAAAARGTASLAVAEAWSRVAPAHDAAAKAQAERETAIAERNAAVAARDAAVADVQTAKSESIAWAGKLPVAEAQKLDIVKQLLASEAKAAQYAARINDLEFTKASLLATNLRKDETIAQLDADIERSKTVTPPRPNASGNTAGGIASMANLRGVVTARRAIQGTEYATISLGSSSNVMKGMRFRVIDGQDFVGYIVIDNVEPQESVGHLIGKPDMLARIRPAVTEVLSNY
jgi:hypothetical protein